MSALACKCRFLMVIVLAFSAVACTILGGQPTASATNPVLHFYIATKKKNYGGLSVWLSNRKSSANEVFSGSLTIKYGDCESNPVVHLGAVNQHNYLKYWQFSPELNLKDEIEVKLFYLGDSSSGFEYAIELGGKRLNFQSAVLLNFAFEGSNTLLRTVN